MTNTLIEKVKLVKFKYDEVNKKTAHDFNIFNVLKIGHLETSVHSKFLSFLLNPNESHQQGNKFIDLFLKEIQIKNFNTENVKIITEKNIGKSIKKKGFIDIYISESNPEPEIIIIENKIFAGDQDEQLKKYYDFAKKKTKEEKIHLFYLTLNGDEPSDKSLKGLDIKKVNLIAYSAEVKNWIIECIKEVALIPSLREILVQYQKLINILTVGNQNQEYMNEMKEILTTNNNHKILNDLEAAIKQIKIDVQVKFWERLLELLEENELESEYSEEEEIRKSVEKFHAKSRNNRRFGVYIYISSFNDIELNLKVAVYNSIYCGFEFFDKKGNYLQPNDYPDEVQIIEKQSEEINLNKWNYLEWNNHKLSNVNFSNLGENEYDFIESKKLDKALNDFIKAIKPTLKKIKVQIEKKHGA